MLFSITCTMPAKVLKYLTCTKLENHLLYIYCIIIYKCPFAYECMRKCHSVIIIANVMCMPSLLAASNFKLVTGW